jgi:hypothetical protein
VSGGGRGRGRGRTHGADALELAHDAHEVLLVEHVLDRHADVDLARADEVHDDAVAVERAEDAGQEAVRDRLAVALHVEHHDALLDRDGRRQLACARARAGRRDAVRERAREVRRVDHAVGAEPEAARAESRRRARGRARRGRVVCVGLDDGAAAARVLDVLDADRNLEPDDLRGVSA